MTAVKNKLCVSKEKENSQLVSCFYSFFVSEKVHLLGFGTREIDYSVIRLKSIFFLFNHSILCVYRVEVIFQYISDKQKTNEKRSDMKS